MAKYNERLVDEFLSEMDDTIYDLENLLWESVENDNTQDMEYYEDLRNKAVDIKSKYEDKVEKNGNLIKDYEKFRGIWGSQEFIEKNDEDDED
ncbi:hypothetical protein [Leptotrichia trevisanii]|jgi:hypothetical protein